MFMLSVLYETGENKIVCDLCTKWSLDNGGKTIVLELKGEATFHDGTTIKAKDIKYSLEKLTGKIDGVVNVRSGFIKEYIDNIEAPDDKTLKINLKRPAPIVLEALTVAYSGILPEGTKRADLVAPPIGPNNKYTSGPFYVKEAVPDSHVLLERNPNYFKKGLPYLDGVKLVAFRDTAAATTALLVGQLDWFVVTGTPPAQFWPQLNKLEKAGKMGVVDKPLYCTSSAGFFNFKDPLFKDIRVRKAVDLAIDRVEYGQVRYDGDYLAQTWVPANTQWGRPESEIWDVIPGYGTGAKKKAEIAEAKQLLVDAGYPNGFDLKLMYSQTFADAEVIQRNLKAIGIKATIDTTSAASQRWAALDYQLYGFRTCLAVGDPDEVVSNYFIKGGGRAFSDYNNPEVERLYLVMSSEQDPAKRKLLYRQMEDLLKADVANITAVDGAFKGWYNSKLHGFTAETTGNSTYRASMHRAESWWLEQ